VHKSCVTIVHFCRHMGCDPYGVSTNLHNNNGCVRVFFFFSLFHHIIYVAKWFSLVLEFFFFNFKIKKSRGLPCYIDKVVKNYIFK
jgi:hypothetical protein